MRWFPLALPMAALLFVPAASAQDASTPSALPVAVASAPATVGQLAPLDRAAMASELAARRSTERATISALRTRLTTATDPAGANALQREIAAAKQEARLDGYRIQLRYARAAGLEESVREFESALNPKPPVLDRAAPSVARRAAAARAQQSSGGSR